MTPPPTEHPVETDELVALARAGDREALEQLLRQVAPLIFRFGSRMCKNAHDAEDVVQDTLISVSEHLADFEGRSSLSSWVFAIARSACARRRRGLKNQPKLGEERLSEEKDPTPSPEAQAGNQQLAAALSGALDQLSDDYREVVLLRDVEGLSAPETAEALGVSVAAVKSRLHRARESLRSSLRPLLEPAPQEAASSCPDVVALWSKKLEGDLAPVDCASMEQHLAGCSSCGAACDALRQVLAACQQVRAAEVSPELQARVKAAVRQWSGSELRG